MRTINFAISRKVVFFEKNETLTSLFPNKVVMATPKQSSLASMFMGGGVKKTSATKTPKVAVVTATAAAATAKLTDKNPLVQEYYDQLTMSQVIAHSLAIEKLGTSYDVVRTHGFLRWMKARTA
jgi:hypothetical protein